MKGSTRKLEKNWKYSWKLVKMKIQPFKLFGIQQKRSSFGGSQYIAIQDSLKKLEKNSTTQANLTPKNLKKEQQIKRTPSRRRELIKIWAELNEIETRRTAQQINKTRSWFFERINKIDKPLASLIKNKREGQPRWLSSLAPAFGPGHDSGVPGSSPTSGSLHGACFSLCLCLCLSLSLWVSHE